jgi:hypothetical protein
VVDEQVEQPVSQAGVDNAEGGQGQDAAGRGQVPGQPGGRRGQEQHAADDGHQRGHGQRRSVGEPAPVQQRRGGIAERAEQHGPGAGQFDGAPVKVDAQQGGHPAQANDQPGEPGAVHRLGPDQPQREHGGEQRVGGGENPGYRGTDMLFTPGRQERGQRHVQQRYHHDRQREGPQPAKCPGPDGQRHEEGGAEYGPAEYHR